MSRHNRFPSFAVAMILCVGTLAAYAQDEVVERQLKAAPGHDVRVGVFTVIRPIAHPARCRRSGSPRRRRTAASMSSAAR